jgi:hypothetical protein
MFCYSHRIMDRSALIRFIAIVGTLVSIAIAGSTVLTGTAQADNFNSTGYTTVQAWDGCEIVTGPVVDVHHSPYWIFAGGQVSGCNRSHPYFAVTVREWVRNPSTGQVSQVQAIGQNYGSGWWTPILETPHECGKGLQWLSGVYVQDDDGSSGWVYSDQDRWAYAPGSC